MEVSASISELAKKYKQFFSDTTKGQIVTTICPYTYELDYASFDPALANRPFSSWDYDKDLDAFADFQIKRHDVFMEHVKGLDNDYVPAIHVGAGYGVNSAFFSGQEVIMGDDTSWTLPFIKDWADMAKLEMNENNPWYQKLLAVTRRFVEQSDGRYAVSAFSNAGPGDLSNALRGDEIFYDLYDEPDYIHELMDKSADATIWLEESLHRIIGDVCGGSVTANVWFPVHAPYLSMDFNDLCADEIFRTFDRPRTQRIINHFGGAYIHHHAKGFHIHKSIAEIENLSMLEISLDPNCERPIDHMDELMEMHGDLPIMIRCHANDVYENIEALKKGRVAIMLNIDNLEQGREVMKFIRKHSKI